VPLRAISASTAYCQEDVPIFAVPPGYWRAPSAVSPKLAPFVAIIDAILDADKQVHAKSILYDNTKIAVAKILGNGQRQRTQSFAELQSHYLFDDKFGRPVKGNDKGKVEVLAGYSRRHFIVPLPEAANFDVLNDKLLDGCLKRQLAVRR
jgi:hypothetical protein